MSAEFRTKLEHYVGKEVTYVMRDKVGEKKKKKKKDDDDDVVEDKTAWTRHAGLISAKHGGFEVTFGLGVAGLPDPDGIQRAEIPCAAFEYAELELLQVWLYNEQSAKFDKLIGHMAAQHATTGSMGDDQKNNTVVGAGKIPTNMPDTPDDGVSAERRLVLPLDVESVKDWKTYLAEDPVGVVRQLKLAYATDHETLRTRLEMLLLWVEVTAGMPSNSWQGINPLVELGDMLLREVRLEHTFLTQKIPRKQMLEQLSAAKPASTWEKAMVAAKAAKPRTAGGQSSGQKAPDQRAKWTPYYSGRGRRDDRSDDRGYDRDRSSREKDSFRERSSGRRRR